MSRKIDSYWRFLIGKEQRTDWLTITLSCLLGGLAICLCYPTPATYSDAFSYVAAAEADTFSIYRPFGYSAFLQLIHVFSHSVHAVIISQIVLYAITLSLFVLAIKRYYPLSKTWIRIVLEVVMALSPVALYMLNALMSDALFCCLIFLMLAMLLVVINEQSWVACGIYLAAFFASLFVRYSAMFFPIAFVPVLLFVRKPALRWTSVALTCALFFVFYRNISNNMYQAVRLHQFSTGFDGWQLANNAMHVLPFIEDDKQPDNRRVNDLHSFAYPRYNDLIVQRTDSGQTVTAGFLWQKDWPLKQYMFRYMQTTRTPYPVAWARLGGGLYADYGKWLIMNYPLLFWKYYLSINIQSVFYPKALEMVGHYSEIPANQPDIRSWFGMDTSQPHAARFPVYESHLKNVLPAIDLITWLLFAAALVVIGWRFPNSRESRLSLIMLFAFGFIYYGTTTFASPIVIRYWMAMHALKLAFVWIALTSNIPTSK